jgi:hypothetical protein
MNGVHYMGSMHGFGSGERGGATFHAQWEKRMHALNATVFSAGSYPPTTTIVPVIHGCGVHR